MGCCLSYVCLYTNSVKKKGKLTDWLSDTYRPPYYHRNAASELMGLVYGEYGGRSDEFMPGSISFECGSKFSPPYTYY